MKNTDPLLQVQDLRVDVGEHTVLKSVSLDVPAGAPISAAEWLSNPASR